MDIPIAESKMPKIAKKSKAVTFTLTDEIIAMLKELAERNSSSMSQEVRRLIIDERKRIDKEWLAK